MHKQSPIRPGSDPQKHAAIHRRVSRVAWWLDNAIGIPGTRLRLGLDSLLGLIPGLGDVAGMLLGATILIEAYRAGAPHRLMLRMAGNLAFDGLLGTVPVLGDVFDFAFRSNAINARLLLEHLDEPPPAPTSRVFSLLVLILLPVLLLGLAGLSIYSLISAWQHWAH